MAKKTVKKTAKTAPVPNTEKIKKVDVDSMLLAVLSAYTDEDDCIESLHDEGIAEAIRYLAKKNKLFIVHDSGNDIVAKAKL